MTEVTTAFKEGLEDCPCGCGAFGRLDARTGHAKDCRIDCPVCARPKRTSRVGKDSPQLRLARRQAATRAAGRCEAAIEGVCTGAGEHAHHLRRRGQATRDTASNLLWVCFMCHAHIHANPAWAAEHGLLDLRKESSR